MPGGPPPSSSRLLTGAAASAVTFASLATVAAHRQPFGFDHGVRDLIGFTRHPTLQSPMELVSMLGEGTGLVPLIALGSAMLWRPGRHWAVALPGVMAGAGALQLGAKWAVDRPRPDLTPWGFPSGHVLVLVVFFGLIAYLLHRLDRARRWRGLATASCVIPVPVVAFSRLYLDVHWLSDLAGGLAIGLAYLLLAIWLVERIQVRRAG
jgi:undecaprenyl-diphosphatase